MLVSTLKSFEIHPIKIAFFVFLDANFSKYSGAKWVKISISKKSGGIT